MTRKALFLSLMYMMFQVIGAAIMTGLLIAGLYIVAHPR